MSEPSGVTNGVKELWIVPEPGAAGHPAAVRIVCKKHALPGEPTVIGVPCPHCTEDAKIMEERLRAVAGIIAPSWEDWPKHQMLYEALRDLVREIKRS